MKRKYLSDVIKKQIAASQSWKCASCHKILPPTYQIDHIIRWSICKSHDPSNLQALCPDCHAQKTAIETIKSSLSSVSTYLPCPGCNAFISTYFNMCWICGSHHSHLNKT